MVKIPVEIQQKYCELNLLSFFVRSGIFAGESVPYLDISKVLS